ncbi:S1 family peptidase [Streptomyces aidingensis]|uniref:Trypsin-like peptidase domain-containing protein n=1 Tax=Streptomyces aidingensis TaxID=910347 RepID=A0A1I1HU36_9ACTN|nr:serine protease [Streptomyces aidingensis]SFC27659.1 Trypsin-like peptidase domain-containing protein [Streptomyces aidingensis]
MLEPRRIAQIIVRHRNQPEGRGSGYLFSANTVLTAAHVVAGGDPPQVTARFDAGRPQERVAEAKVVWQHPDLDLAVLALASRPGGELPPAPIGRIGPHDAMVPCRLSGFPLYKARTVGGVTYRDREHLEAVCPALANSREGTLALRIDNPPHPPGPLWKGISGAAVFGHGRLVGIVTSARSLEHGALTASHIGRWAEILLQEDDGENLLRRLEELLGGHRLEPGRLPDVADAAARAAARLPPGIRPHWRLAQLPGPRLRHLTEQRLSFVRPEDGRHRADPDRLWEWLSGAAPSGSGYQEPVRGLMVAGLPGSGKTRTCFEVASRAERDDWQALHVAADARVSADDLLAAVDAVRGHDVLLVLDDADALSGLDLERFAEEAPEVVTPGVRVACIAAARSSAAGTVATQTRFPENFETVALCQDDEHQRRVHHRILDTVAPGAIKVFGRAAVADHCRDRPALAVMLAQRAEEAARAGRPLETATAPGPGPAGAAPRRWMRQNIDRDRAQLSRYGGNAENTMLAAAVAALSCPQPSAAVHAAVRHFLGRPGGPALDTGAEGLISSLVKLGWLVRSGAELDVMHHLTIDEFMRQVCVPDDVWFRGETLGKLLNALLTDVTTFRLAARQLRRWAGDLPEPDRQAVGQVCDNWLGTRGSAVGVLLTDAPDHAEARAALLTLLTGAPWQSGTVAQWDTVVAPWLGAAGQESPEQVDGLLTSAVRDTADAVPEPLAAAALQRLGELGDPAGDPTRDPTRGRGRGRGLMEALLRAKGISGPLRDKVLRAAHGRLGPSVAPQNRPVFAALVDRSDLSDGARREVLGLGLTGAERWLPSTGAALLLWEMLRRHDGLGRTGLRDAVQLAHRWLRVHGDDPRASFVYTPLLELPDPGAHGAGFAVPGALSWLEHRETSPGAGFVLRRLLPHPGLGPGERERAVGHALRWLADRGRGKEASFVLAPLLSQLGAGHDRLPKVRDHTLDWLRRHGLSTAACFVYKALLERTDLPEIHDEAAGQAVGWLGLHCRRRDAGSVLPLMLGLSGHAPETCAAALDWLEEHRTLPEATHTLAPLLYQRALDPGQSGRAAGYALDWLDRHRTASEASFVLKPLLTRLPADRLPEAVAHGLAWLELHGGQEEARFVLGALLDAARPEEELPAPLLDHAVDWLHGRPVGQDTHRVLLPLLARRELNAKQRRRAVRTARELSELAPDAAWQRELVKKLAWLGPLPAEQADYVAERVRTALAPPISGSLANDLLPPALRRRDVRPEDARRFADLAQEWLERNVTSRNRGRVLAALLAAQSLDPVRRQKAVRAARLWLDAAPDDSTRMAGLIRDLTAGHQPGSATTGGGTDGAGDTS